MLTYLSASLNLPHLPRRQRGLTMVEYALGGALIAIAIIVGLKVLGGNLNTGLNNIGAQVTP